MSRVSASGIRNNARGTTSAEWKAASTTGLKRSDSSLSAIFEAQRRDDQPYASFSELEPDEWLEPELDCCVAACRCVRGACKYRRGEGEEAGLLRGPPARRFANRSASRCFWGLCEAPQWAAEQWSACAADGSLTRAWLLCINSLASILLGCLMMELAWDAGAGAYLDRHEGVEQLKVAILVLTVMHELQLMEYYWHSWKAKKRALHKLYALAKAGVHHSAWPLPPRPLHLWQLLAEMLLGLLIPLPDRALGLHERTGLLLFLRLYLVIRLAHKLAPVYRMRHELAAFSGVRLSGSAEAALRSAAGKGDGAAVALHPTRHAMSAAAVRRVEFGVALSLKSIFDAAPFAFVACCFAMFFFPLTFAIYVQERDHQPEAFDLASTAWFAIVTATTVGFGGIEVVDEVGRFLSMILCISGVVLISLLVVAVTKHLDFSDDEAVVWELVRRMQSHPELRKRASAALAATDARFTEFTAASPHDSTMPSQYGTASDHVAGQPGQEANADDSKSTTTSSGGQRMSEEAIADDDDDDDDGRLSQPLPLPPRPPSPPPPPPPPPAAAAGPAQPGSGRSFVAQGLLDTRTSVAGVESTESIRPLLTGLPTRLLLLFLAEQMSELRSVPQRLSMIESDLSALGHKSTR